MIGTWCARKEPSIWLPSTTFGPVQPFGVRSTIIGHFGLVRSSFSLAFFWIALISSIAWSKAAAILLCISIGSPPSTKYGFQPHPSKKCSNSSREIRAKMVGLLILYPFRCRIGKTAPSVFGFKNLLHCQEVASGPVSDSPSPTIHAATRSGLSNTAPKECASEYPSSPPSLMEPGVSGATWLEIPPGKENCLHSFFNPSISSPMFGYTSL